MRMNLLISIEINNFSFSDFMLDEEVGRISSFLCGLW